LADMNNKPEGFRPGKKGNKEEKNSIEFVARGVQICYGRQRRKALNVGMC